MVEGLITVVGADLLGVHPALLSLRIVGKTIRAVQGQLFAQRVQYRRWDVGRLLEERAQKSDRRQLQRESQAVVIAALLGNHPTVRIVQMEVSSQLVGRRIAG